MTIAARRTARQALSDWREHGRLAARPALDAWRATEPVSADWRRWLDVALLGFGAALLCAGVIVFFAFNWEALHKFAKFGLLAGAVALAAGFAWLRPPGDLPGRAALGGAQVLSGVLLAVIGQTYQTGADAWQLFAIWTLVAVPWALAARAKPLWWLVLAVGNVALLRYFSVQVGVQGVFDMLFMAGPARTAMWLLGAVLLQFVLWYGLGAVMQGVGLGGPAGARLLAALACGYAGCLGIAGLFRDAPDLAGILLSALSLAALCWWFRQRAFDIVALSLTTLTAIMLVIAGAARGLLHHRFEFESFLLLGMLTVGLAAAAAKWLMHAHRAPHLEKP